MRPAVGLILRSPPGWVLQPGGILAAVDIDFANSRVFPTSVPSATNISCVRAAPTSGADYVDDLAGIWYPVGGNIPRISNKGCLVEESRINVVLRNRDLSNAAWTKTNVTAALDQTGIDGTANAASSIISTAGNGTCLQAITLASSARWQTAFVKRITGSGNIDMTMDGGSTWTTISGSISSTTWTRVAIATQTLANPSVGFRIVTSGDKVAVDFVQNENSGVFATSPILVTSAAVTRAADGVTITNVPTFGNAYTIFGKGTPSSPIGNATRQELFVYSDMSNNNYVGLERAATTGNANGRYKSAGSNFDVNAGTSWALSTSGKLAAAYAASDQAISFNGAAVATGSSALVPVNTTLGIGHNNNGGSFWCGYVERVAIWPTTRLSNALLQAITA